MLHKVKVLIIHPEGNISVNQNLSVIIETLNENGFKVDILSQKLPGNSQKNNLPAKMYRFRKFPNLIEAGNYSWGLGKVLCFFLKFIGRRYSLILGINANGIIAADMISRLSNTPIGLISYEIFFADEVDKKLKQQEIIACENIKFAVCQDEIRSQKLSEETKIPQDLIFHIPVAGRQVNISEKDKNYLRNKFSIKDDYKIALYMGDISRWAGIERIIEDIGNWPDDWALVIHGRYKEDIVYRYLDKLSEMQRQKIFISSSPFDNFSDLFKLPISADIGIAIYIPDYTNPYTGKNLEYLGWSSGKIATYLQCGLPVLINVTGLISDDVERYNLGFVVKGGEKISDVLKRISLHDLINKKTLCREFFLKKLDFKKYEDSLLDLCRKACLRQSGFSLSIFFLTIPINIYHFLAGNFLVLRRS